MSCEGKVCLHESINFYTNLNALGIVCCIPEQALGGRVAPCGLERGWIHEKVETWAGPYTMDVLIWPAEGKRAFLVEVITWGADMVYVMERRERAVTRRICLQGLQWGRWRRH